MPGGLPGLCGQHRADPAAPGRLPRHLQLGLGRRHDDGGDHVLPRPDRLLPGQERRRPRRAHRGGADHRDHADQPGAVPAGQVAEQLHGAGGAGGGAGGGGGADAADPARGRAAASVGAGLAAAAGGAADDGFRGRAGGAVRVDRLPEGGIRQPGLHGRVLVPVHAGRVRAAVPGAGRDRLRPGQRQHAGCAERAAPRLQRQLYPHDGLGRGAGDLRLDRHSMDGKHGAGAHGMGGRLAGGGAGGGRVLPALRPLGAQTARTPAQGGGRG